VTELARAYGRGLWEERHVLGYTLLVSLTLFIAAPFAMIALRSVGKGWFGRRWLPPELTLDWYRWALEVGSIPEVLKNSLIIGVIAVAVSTAIGVAAGWAFGRRRVPGKEVVMALLLLPLMIPSITYALGVARTFRDKKLPCDGLIYLGTEFTPSGWNTRNGEFTWKAENFPEPKKMIDMKVLYAIVGGKIRHQYP